MKGDEGREQEGRKRCDVKGDRRREKKGREREGEREGESRDGR